MMGKGKGLIKIINNNNNAEILFYQCILPQTSSNSIFGKLSATVKDVMDSLIKLMNFMRSRSAFQQRQFKQFLPEYDQAYCDLLQHNVS